FRWMIASLVIAVVLNIVLNYYWIQSRGAFGAALATLATQLFMLCSYTIYGVYIFRLRVRLKYVAQLALFAGACLVLVFLLDSVHWFADDLKNMGMRMLLYFVSVPVLALLSGLVGRQTLALKVGIAE
ncbi:MAG TPA: polysaccharide biosynthesis C-terminal domain-containing protein, partial [Chitinophagales bacterium]|nr:polysaccharide biosynthesis C-terminal domain-containing protein [Chitinophagales bacterium]